MTRLYAVPSGLLLVIVCVLGVAAAVGGQTLVHRSFRRLDFLQHNEVAGFIIAVVGTLYAVTLAFVVSIVWQEYDASATHGALEAAEAATAWHMAAGLPRPLASSTRAAIVEYARTMIVVEWPLMRHGLHSDRGEAIVTGMIHDLATFRPANAGTSNVQAQELSSIGDMHRLRNERLEDNNSGLSMFQWSILLLGAIVVVGFCYLFGLRNEVMHGIMTGCVACIIAAAFVLIFELDYPFHGDLAISSEPWQFFLRSIGTTW